MHQIPIPRQLIIDRPATPRSFAKDMKNSPAKGLLKPQRNRKKGVSVVLVSP